MTKLTKQRDAEFKAALREGPNEALAWLKAHHFDDINVDYIPNIPWVSETLRLGIAAARRDSGEIAGLRELINSITHYEMLWQHFRNDGAMQWEKEDRQDFIAELRKYLRQWAASKAKIDEIVAGVMEDETNGWLAKGSEAWLEVQRSNAEFHNLSLDEYLARREAEIEERHRRGTITNG